MADFDHCFFDNKENIDPHTHKTTPVLRGTPRNTPLKDITAQTLGLRKKHSRIHADVLRQISAVPVELRSIR